MIPAIFSPFLLFRRLSLGSHLSHLLSLISSATSEMLEKSQVLKLFYATRASSPSKKIHDRNTSKFPPCSGLLLTFEEFGLQCFDGYKHYELQFKDENRKALTTALQELKMFLRLVCLNHELPLAMTWVPCSACNDLLRVEFSALRDHDITDFQEVSKCSHLRKGQVAGWALSSPNMLYCSDVTQLSLVEYPLVPYARLCKFSGWFTICLQSVYTGNDTYVLEFFLPTSHRFHDHLWALLNLVLGTMLENFRTFKLASGQELGEVLSIEVINFQNDQRSHHVKMIQAVPSDQVSSCDSTKEPGFQDTNREPGFQDAKMMTIKAKYRQYTIKFKLSLSSRLVELQQAVTRRLNLEAGTCLV